MNGFMGVGMMNMASGGVMGGAVSNAFNNQNQVNNTNTSTQTTGNVKFCGNCGNPTSGGNFCTNCGNKLN